MVDTERLGNLRQGFDRRIACPAFDTTDILLAQTGSLGDLLLCEASRRAQTSKIVADQFAHVHAQLVAD